MAWNAHIPALSPLVDAQHPGEAPPHVLVLDDQPTILSLLRDVLTAHQYRVSLAQNLEEAGALLGCEAFDAILVDIFLNPDESGLSLLPRIRELQPHTPAIVISGMASMDHVMEALKAGAYDMLTKPFNIVDVLGVVGRAVEKKRMAAENVRLMEALRQERDHLEERVQAATKDLKEKVETLRLLNQQVTTMFEMSQMQDGDGSTEGVLRRVFELLRRMIDFEGAFCVVYDIVAQGITLTHADGAQAEEFCQGMGALIREHGGRLIEIAATHEHLPLREINSTVRQLYRGSWPERDVMLMPLYVHQTMIGVVGLIRRERSAHLSEAEERILALAIAHFIAAIEQRSYVARTKQLAGLGELISEIAHDLRHPMTALRGASRILLDGWRDETRRTRCLDEIQGNLGRMESMVSELVNFYNPKEMNLAPVDLNGLLDKAVSVSSHVLEQKGIVVEREFAEGPIMILGLTRNLVEAFINLISNACQAMESDGRLTLRTCASMEEEHRQRLLKTGRLPEQYVLAQVEDNGCGIPEENQERVFRRFFTTRPEGHGLGLSAVQRIVKKNLGHIHFESAVGQGTVFHLYLPKA